MAGGTMLLYSQEDADRAATRNHVAAPRDNQYKANAQRRKAERLFGILYSAGVHTEADFALVTDQMWALAAGVAMKDIPGPTVREMVALMYEGK